MLTSDQADIARIWLDKVDDEIKSLRNKEVSQDEESMRRILTLRVNRSIGWEDDHRWNSMMRLAENILPCEPRSALL